MACRSDSSEDSSVDKPHQPVSFSFPKRAFGKKNVVLRSFQASWFTSWSWLSYDEANDTVRCHLCSRAVREKKMKTGNSDAAFLSKGFSNWKDATMAFRQHEKSGCHKVAVEMLLTLPTTTADVGELLSSTLAQEKADNRHCFLKVLSSLRFLAKQGCSIRGHEEKDGNFYQLFSLFCEDDTRCQAWLRKKCERYVSWETQNEVLKIMAMNVLRKIASNLQATEFFAIMMDECTDAANKEQVVLVLRWVDDNLSVHEEFIGLSCVKSIEASCLVFVVKDSLLRLNLTLAKARGQCYDGASNMSGLRNGVARQIQDEEPRAIYTHCYGHSLNLAASDTIKRCKTMKKALETTHEITKLVKYSPRREGLFRSIQGEMTPGSCGIRTLCPTRWTVRADSMQSIITNYSVIEELWEQAASIVHDTETIARIRGVASQMQCFDFFFGLILGENLLRHTDNLSKTLQKSCSASEGQKVADMTRRTLQGIRSEECFDLFWEKVTRMAEELDVSDPVLPRKRKVPKRFEEGSAPAEFQSTPKSLYRQVYYEALDLLVQAIGDRFDQPGYKIYCCLEALIIRAVRREDFAEELERVLSLYGSDLNASNLKTQLEILGSHIECGHNMDIVDVKKLLQQMNCTEKALLSEVLLVMKLILVMPATNASSERTFSAMRRVKSYLRSTMTQERLNHLMLLHVHKDLTASLSLADVANEFVSRGERRLQVFGKF